MLTLSFPYRRVQLTLSKIRRAARELLTLEGFPFPSAKKKILYILSFTLYFWICVLIE
jgi:hypothetical protein